MHRPVRNCYKRAVTTNLAWRRSSRCGSTTCVEIARDGDHYLIRDSKNPDQPPHRFDQAEWVEFLDRIQYGDLPVR